MRKKKKSMKSAGTKTKAKVRAKVIAKAPLRKASAKPKKTSKPKKLIKTATLAPTESPSASASLVEVVITYEMIVEKAREIWARKIAIAESNYDDQNWREAEAELRGTKI